MSNKKFKVKNNTIEFDYNGIPISINTQLGGADVLDIFKRAVDCYINSGIKIGELKKDIIKYIMTVSITLIGITIGVIHKLPNMSNSFFLIIGIILFVLTVFISIFYWAVFINSGKKIMEKIPFEVVELGKKIYQGDTDILNRKNLNSIIKQTKKFDKEKYFYFAILFFFIGGLIGLILGVLI